MLGTVGSRTRSLWLLPSINCSTLNIAKNQRITVEYVMGHSSVAYEFAWQM